MATSQRQYNLEDHVRSDEEKEWAFGLLSRLCSREVVQNPIVIHGRHGTGKSHLLNCLHESLKSQGEGSVSALVPAEGLIAAILEKVRGEGSGALDAFLGVDVLLIDNVQRFSRKTETQRLLVDLLRTPVGLPPVSCRAVVVAGTFDGLGDGSHILDDWFCQGEWVSLRPSGFRDRCELVRQMLASEGVRDANSSVIEHIADRVVSSRHQLQIACHLCGVQIREAPSMQCTEAVLDGVLNGMLPDVQWKQPDRQQDRPFFL